MVHHSTHRERMINVLTSLFNPESLVLFAVCACLCYKTNLLQEIICDNLGVDLT